MRCNFFFFFLPSLIFISFALSEEKSCEPQKNIELRESMRTLWTDHIIWIRQYIVGYVAKLKDTSASLKRLSNNEEDIGRLFATYYGKETGETLTKLLKESTASSANVINALVKDLPDDLKKAEKKWHENADDLTDFLTKANPNLYRLDLKSMLYRHLDLTKKEMVFRLNKNWEEDVLNFENIFDQALKMADVFSDGIVKQFLSKEALPDKKIETAAFN